MKAIWQNFNISSWCWKRSKLIKHKKVELIYTVCAREEGKRNLLNFDEFSFSLFFFQQKNSSWKYKFKFQRKENVERLPCFLLFLLCFIEWREPNSHKKNHILPSHTQYNQVTKKCHVPCYTWDNHLPPPQTHKTHFKQAAYIKNIKQGRRIFRFFTFWKRN